MVWPVIEDLAMGELPRNRASHLWSGPEGMSILASMEQVPGFAAIAGCVYAIVLGRRVVARNWSFEGGQEGP
jgi:hypothetical protein